ncbi:unnamed protein product [Moneuplotes crassus]|uniref:Uncharacterized protein n=1 Tax=Euplotes crassus TaxID=5936 RepID=A0AAD2D409_EUPCR|nr:unnamed protein product [Moneuplotes crassus]
MSANHKCVNHSVNLCLECRGEHTIKYSIMKIKALSRKTRCKIIPIYSQYSFFESIYRITKETTENATMICYPIRKSKETSKKIIEIDDRLSEIKEIVDKQEEPKMVELSLVQEIQEYFINIPEMISKLAQFDGLLPKPEEPDFYQPPSPMDIFSPSFADPILSMIHLPSENTHAIEAFRAQFKKEIDEL